MSTRPPILSLPDEITNLDRAAHQIGRSKDTVRRWCHLYGIAHQPTPGSPLEINRLALEMARYGDVRAIELLREGRRDAPEVKRYAEHIGLPT
ncbi:hypothetical protein NGM99_12670 [Mesorhizobium sp. RP14(2022)]|uniref:MerR family transcriptional regulator n=1 Tax=Mesorhizobium liriopis TaxID=2953882 RepID=A0ABT1C731_9HYPH|nr:hypothetical protein [Mesorhizobium liriopis]MCO6050636.1 hypothetical protein [Mesorhizobium liriopis]